MPLRACPTPPQGMAGREAPGRPQVPIHLSPSDSPTGWRGGGGFRAYIPRSQPVIRGKASRSDKIIRQRFRKLDEILPNDLRRWGRTYTHEIRESKSPYKDHAATKNLAAIQKTLSEGVYRPVPASNRPKMTRFHGLKTPRFRPNGTRSRQLPVRKSFQLPLYCVIIAHFCW